MCKKENKNYRFIPFLSDSEQKTPKQIAIKVQKIKKYHYDVISGQNRLEKADKE